MAQHVTFFRMKVQPGKADDLKRRMHDRAGENARQAALGWERTIAGQSKNDPNTFWVAVTWDTTERYMANADSPEQNSWFQETRALLASDPEWFDCDVVEEQSA